MSATESIVLAPAVVQENPAPAEASPNVTMTVELLIATNPKPSALDASPDTVD